MALFEGCQIVLDLTTAVKFKEKTAIRKDITSNGGIVSFIVTKKSTHVICDDIEKAEFSYKCKMAAKYGIPVVSVDWIKKSIEAGHQLSTDDYLMAGKSKSEGLKEGKISASRFQKKDKKKSVKPFINIGSFKVWKQDEKNCPTFSKEFQIAKFALFKGEKKEKKVQKTFAVLEVHVNEHFSSVNSDTSHKYRVTSHSGTLCVVEKGGPGTTEYRFCNTVDETLAVYSHLYREQQQSGMTLTHDLFSRHIGSEKFKQMMGELGLECGSMTEDVGCLVEHIWLEANEEVEKILSCDVTSIKEEQVEKAEAILKQVKSALDSGDTSKITKLMNDFYTALPHKHMYRVTFPMCGKGWLSRKHDICQLVKDMISVNEATDFSRRASTPAKYRSLRCGIDSLNPTSTEFHTVKQLIEESLTGNCTVKIEAIFAVNRPVEGTNFTQDIPNKQLLFHASKANNIVGILSRGLLMPRVVVEDHGGTRSDPGMLGSGIYFASAASTSVGYSSPSNTKGTRFMLVSEVALGNCKNMYGKDLTLTCVPEGYNSVHGVKTSTEVSSAFKDDEYVVYSPGQQRLKYLVEFTTDTDVIKETFEDYVNIEEMSMTDDEDANEISLKDVKDIVDPMSKVKAGLVSNDDAPVNLKSVHVRAKLMDLASEVIVLQEYENNSKKPLEAKYVFPLGDLAAVCGFEAFINGKHIVGEVKEKEQAHKEYKKAISEGHGAYLMDQDEETPDVFTVSVGNLPPGATVLIKITYVAELQVEGEMISFRLPGSVAPWKKDSLKETTQHETETIEVKQGETTLQVSIEMPFDIRSIECPSQKIKVKRTLTKATVEMMEGESIADGFQLLIGLAEIHVPRMWVERKPEDQNHQACMLAFYPEFEACESDDVNVILLLDLSNSMKGDAIVSAKKILLLTLQHLPSTWNFNIVVFGTAWKELFPSCVLKTAANMKLASEFVMNLSAAMGNTEVVRPLHTFYLMKPENSMQNILLISDGHMNNSEQLLSNVLKNCQHTRIFTVGVSDTADRHLLRALARVGAGSFEYFDAKVKSKWETKVKSQISKAAQPGLTSVHVDWEQHGADVPSPVQAPRQITALFNGSRSVIYGYVPNCTMATLRASIAGEEVSTMVSTSDLSITDGNILHRLTARAIISDWEDGVLSDDRTDHEIVKMKTKEFIIELSKQYSIVTQFTSFVAIEKRDKDEEKKAIDAPSMSELVAQENVDQLQYMGFEEAALEGRNLVDSVATFGDDMEYETEYLMMDNDETTEGEGESDDSSYEDSESGGDILEINEIFRDLAVMIQAQGEQVDNIEANVEQANTEVEHGLGQLLKATIIQGSGEWEEEGGDTGSRELTLSREESDRPLARIALEVDEESDEDMGFGLFDDDINVSLHSRPLARMAVKADTSESEESDEDMGFGLFDDDINVSDLLSLDYSTETKAKSVGGPMAKAKPAGLDKDRGKKSSTTEVTETKGTTFFAAPLSKAIFAEKDVMAKNKLDDLDKAGDKRSSATENIEIKASTFYSAPLQKTQIAEKAEMVIAKPAVLEARFCDTRMDEQERALPLSKFASKKKKMVEKVSRSSPPKTEVKPQSISFVEDLLMDNFLTPQLPQQQQPQQQQQQQQPRQQQQQPMPQGQTFGQQSMFDSMPVMARAGFGAALFPMVGQQESNMVSQRPMFGSAPTPLGSAPLPMGGLPVSNPFSEMIGGAPPPPQPASGIVPPMPPSPPRDAALLRLSPLGFVPPAQGGAPAPQQSYQVKRSSEYKSMKSSPKMAPAPPSQPASEITACTGGAVSAERMEQLRASLMKKQAEKKMTSIIHAVRSSEPGPTEPSLLEFEAREMAVEAPKMMKPKVMHKLAMSASQSVDKLEESFNGGGGGGGGGVENVRTGGIQARGPTTASHVSWRAVDAPLRSRKVHGSRALSELKVINGTASVEDVEQQRPVTTDLDIEGLDGDTRLHEYGIGLQIPVIVKPGNSGLMFPNLGRVIKLQNMRGYWDMDGVLQDLLGIDFDICKGVLEKAGLKSLGLKCYEEVIGIVSTTIVLLRIFKLLVPQAFPRNCKLSGKEEELVKMVADKVYVTKFEPAGTEQDKVRVAIDMAFEYCVWVYNRHPLVCSNLELGSSWYEFVGKSLNLHIDEMNPEKHGTTKLMTQTVKQPIFV